MLKAKEAIAVQDTVRITTSDLDTARAEITATLDWMARTKKTGGCGYAPSRVKKTNAYKSLLALGGEWPT